MIRALKLLICMLVIILIFGACANEVILPSKLTEPEQTTSEIQTTNPLIGSVFSEGPNWIVTVREGPAGTLTYGYIIFDDEGNELVDIQDSGAPGFTFINENLLRADSPGGNAMGFTRFFDLEHGLYSPEYTNVLLFDYGLVIYRDWRHETDNVFYDMLIVHDMFDPEYNRNEFQRDFRTGVFDDVVPHELRLIDENTLFMAYYNNQNELVEERLKLR